MNTTQKFEGPELAALLDHVHATLGPNAQVVAANRCRSRGVAGFFARETFELTVEVPGSPEDDPDGALPARPRSRKRTSRAATGAGGTSTGSALERLMAAADDADEIGHAPSAAGRTRAGGRRADAMPTNAMHTDDFDGRTPGTGKPANNGHDRAGSPSNGRPGSEHRLALLASPGPARPGHDGDDANHDDSHFEDVLRRARAQHPAQAAPTGALNATEDSGPTTSKKSDGRFLRRRRTRAGQSQEETPVLRVIDLSALESDVYASSLAPHPARRDDLATRSSAALAAHPAGHYVPRGDVPVSSLIALGVPAPWLSASVNGRVLLDSVLARIPSPPPILHANGAILAFVGEGDSALVTARAVAGALRQDPDSCIFLSPGDLATKTPCVRIRALDDLAAKRDSWVQEDEVTIVAIDAGFGRPDVAWGRQAISVLHPSMRWGVVSATRKAEDIHQWARGIGGLHALAVNGILETASPVSVLASGIPVARVDGQIASPELWRRLIDERLAESVTRRTPDLIAT